jgi:hypothetical protein
MNIFPKRLLGLIDRAQKSARLEHFQAKHALGLDPGVDTGSPLRKCDHSKRKERSPILSKRDSL